MGEKFFMQHLLDGDFSSNNGGWQWSASTGTDAVPYFRIFNPTTQGVRFDPDGHFIRQYCPELRACTNKEIHSPSEMQRKELGYTIALDDYEHKPVWKHFYPYIDIIKFDLRAMTMDEIAGILIELKPQSHIDMLAEKVETLEEFEQCKKLGFKYFSCFSL